VGPDRQLSGALDRRPSITAIRDPDIDPQVPLEHRRIVSAAV
jgi:hypothetical protein